MSDLPQGWTWTTLDDLQAPESRAITDGPFGSHLASRHYSDSGARVIRLQNIGDGRFIDAKAFIPLNHFETLRAHEVREGDLVLASLGEDLPRACIVPNLGVPAIVKADCIRVRLSPHVERRWVLYALLAPQTRKHVQALIHGVGRPRLGLKHIRAIPMPLPPLAEQRRIIDALEDHLSRLDAGFRLASLAKRRLAVLLDTGRYLVATGRIANYWSILPIGDAYRSSEGITNGWRWARPDEVTSGARSDIVIGPFGSNLKVSDYTATGVPLVFVRNIRSRKFGIMDRRYISPAKAKQLSAHEVTRGDLLITKMGEPPGDACVYDEDEPSIITADCIRLRPGPEMSSKYLEIAVQSRLVREQVEKITRGVAQRKISLARFRSEVLIPVPPLKRQQRAVAWFQELHRLADRLETEVDRLSAKASNLRKALFATALSGQLVKQDPFEESAKILLTAIEKSQQTHPSNCSPNRKEAR